MAGALLEVVQALCAEHMPECEADLRTCDSPEAAAAADGVSAMRAAATGGEQEAVAAAAERVVNATTAAREKGDWAHVAFREAHIVSLFGRALGAVASGRPSDAMRDVDMAAILGAPPDALEAFTREVEPAAKEASAFCPDAAGAVWALPGQYAGAPPLGASPAASPCPAADSLTPAEFKAKYYRCSEPVLLRADPDVAAWPALERWCDLQHFGRVGGWRTVPAEIGWPDRAGWREEPLLLADLVTRLAQHQDGDPPLYCAQHELLSHVAPLADDVGPAPGCMSQCPPVERVNCWLGTAGTVTELHRDGYDNLFVQVAGCKYIRLYAPAHASRLHVDRRKGSGRAAQGNCSKLRCEREDYQECPRAEGVPYYECVVSAGQCLFIPQGWWHYLRALTPSASVNLWF
eukprot:TRINITY_DN26045_c0_g1_i1.p1 TRINITY_DN26045_c0_g1~~TRINITY_DN26045_c0_g1_i1.p1  ORF type:complete len:405 (+),score=131.36 TRINITY_DN26045_c0_g1_i1:72-1286(+)